MPLNAGEVSLIHLMVYELWVNKLGCRLLFCHDDNTGRVSVEPVKYSDLLIDIHLVNNVVKRVSVEAAARVHRQRRRFINRNNDIVFVKNIDPVTDCRFGRLWEMVLNSPARADNCISRNWILLVGNSVLLAFRNPVFGFKVGVHSRKKINGFVLVESEWHIHGTNVVIRQ